MSDNSQFSALWLSNDKGEDRARTTEVVRNNVFLITRLKEILEKQAAGIEALETSLATYDNTQNWAYKQAHLNGMRQAYKEMMKLTDFLN